MLKSQDESRARLIALTIAASAQVFVFICAVTSVAFSVATVHLPQRVPAGLHGAWLPTKE